MAPPDLGSAEAIAANRTAKGRLKMLLVLLVCAAPVAASYITYFFIRPAGRSNYSTLIMPTRSLPDLPLRSLDGKPVSARSLRGQWLLVAVGPARCDAECEQRLYMQRQFREVLGKERDRLDKVWFITDEDPLPPALAAAVTATPALTALRAERPALAAWLSPEAGHSLEEHLYLVDPMGEWMMRIPAHPEPAKVKRDLERLLRASAFWDTPGR
jgi:cytochrome oxidase Cu insertion factor (SCO1/SenC/PrrC family)